MTSTTTSTCWPTSCSTSARPSIQSSTTWCQPPTARSSSPRCATSACLAAIHLGGTPTPWPATPSASPVTTPSPPTSSKRRHIDRAPMEYSFSHYKPIRCLWLLLQLHQGNSHTGLETVGTGWSSTGSPSLSCGFKCPLLYFRCTFYYVLLCVVSLFKTRWVCEIKKKWQWKNEKRKEMETDM